MKKEHILTAMNQAWQEFQKDLALDRVIYMPSYPELDTLRFEDIEVVEDVGGYVDDYGRCRGAYISGTYFGENINFTYLHEAYAVSSSSISWYISGYLNANVNGSSFISDNESLKEFLGMSDDVEDDKDFLVRSLQKSPLSDILNDIISKQTEAGLKKLENTYRELVNKKIDVKAQDYNGNIQVIFTNTETQKEYIENLQTKLLDLNNWD